VFFIFILLQKMSNNKTDSDSGYYQFWNEVFDYEYEK
jgi:hypothetical protein